MWVEIFLSLDLSDETACSSSPSSRNSTQLKCGVESDEEEEEEAIDRNAAICTALCPFVPEKKWGSLPRPGSVMRLSHSCARL